MQQEKKILKFDNLVYEVKNKDKEIYSDYARIINGLSGEIESGKLTAVMGGSGCGKTHFFELLIGNLPTDCKTSGSITYNGEEREWGSWTKQIAFLPQDDIYYPDLTVYESIMYNLSFDSSLTKKQMHDRAIESLESSGIIQKKDAPIKTLSGGERKRAMIAITLVNDPEILILDEPTTGLDSNSSLKIVSGLKEYAEKYNKIVIMTVHQPGEGLFNLFGDLIFLTRGGVFYKGPVQDIKNFLKNHNIDIPDNVSLAEFLFLLHSNENQYIVDTSRYKNIIADIEERNVEEILDQPRIRNNCPVFRSSFSISHPVILLKHNFNLLLRSPGRMSTLITFLIFAGVSFVISYFKKNFFRSANFFDSIGLTDRISDLSFTQKLILAYSIFLYNFFHQIIIYTTIFSVDRQDKKIRNLEIFTSKYSTISHHIYQYLQKFLVALFFITVDFLINIAKGAGNQISFEIIGYIYLVMVFFLMLTIITSTLITTFITGPKMQVFVLFSTYYSVYYMHPLALYFIMKNLGFTFMKYTYQLALILPNTACDLVFTVMVHKEFVLTKDNIFKVALSYLKYPSGVMNLAINASDLREYLQTPEWPLKIFLIPVDYFKMKIISVSTTLIFILVSFYVNCILKAPSIRTKL